MDDGRGGAEFLDELIPVEGWAAGGQHNTHEQPQGNGGELPPSGTNSDQPEEAATPEPSS
jgi:hypothetical protein